MKKKLVTLAILAAMGIAASAPASAGSSTGNVTISGTAVVTCTISSPAVDFGAAVPVGRGAQTKTFSIDVNCPSGAAWSMTSSNTATPITVGADSTSNNAVVMDAAGTAYISGAGAVQGVGTGAAQSTTLSVKLNGNTAGIVGTGAISGSVPVTLAY